MAKQTDGGTDSFVFLGIFTGPYLEIDQKRNAISYCMLTVITKCLEKLTKILQFTRSIFFYGFENEKNRRLLCQFLPLTWSKLAVLTTKCAYIGAKRFIRLFLIHSSTVKQQWNEVTLVRSPNVCKKFQFPVFSSVFGHFEDKKVVKSG